MLKRSLLHRALLGLACLSSGAMHVPAHAQAPDTLIPWRAAQSASVGVVTHPLQAAPAHADGVLLQGTVVQPVQQSDVLSMPLSGVVQAVLVTPLQTVRAGQPVARLMSPELVQWQRDWLYAETQARLAREKAQREEQLFSEGIVSEVRRNESRAQAEMATLAARERRQALRLAGLDDAALQQAAQTASLSPQLTLTAPVAGTVLEPLATPGQRLEAGSPLAQIARGGTLALEVQASQAQAARLRVGDRLMVEGCKAPARITALSPQLQSSTQSVTLRAVLTAREDCLRIHQFVQLRWQGGTLDTLGFSVPAAAVVQQGRQHYVFVQQAQGFRAVPVQLLTRGEREVRISGALQAGEAVAVQGVAAIKGAWLGLGRDEASGAAAGSPSEGK